MTAMLELSELIMPFYHHSLPSDVHVSPQNPNLASGFPFMNTYNHLASNDASLLENLDILAEGTGESSGLLYATGLSFVFITNGFNFEVFLLHLLAFLH